MAELEEFKNLIKILPTHDQLQEMKDQLDEDVEKFRKDNAFFNAEYKK